MRVKIIAVLALLFCSNIIWAKAREEVNLVKDERGGYTLEFEVPDHEVYKVNRLGLRTFTNPAEEIYSQIRIPRYHNTEEIGKPELPVFTFYMAIAGFDQVPTFEVLHSVEKQVSLEHPCFPAQIPWPKSQPIEERPFSKDTEYYQSQGQRPALASVAEVFDIRNVPCVMVKLYPYSYNPAEKKLTIIKNFTLKINTATTTKITGLNSNVFEKYLRHILVNFDDMVEPVRNKQKDDYVIITAPEYESGLNDFVSFRQIRFNVQMVTTATTGTSTSAIESYIDALDPTPSFILLVGDTDKIPSNGSPASDVYYASTDSDVHAEIMLGRFSVADATDLSNIIRKTIYMEENLAKFDKKAVFIGGTDAGSGSIAEGTHDYVINTYLNPDGYDCLKLYTNSDGSASESKHTTAVNEGVIFDFYSGHGGNTSWAVGPWSVTATDINGYSNEIYPFTAAFACYTGTYTGSCIAESWIRAENGAVANIGSSTTSYWGGDDDFERGMFDAFYDSNDPIPSYGGGMNAGKLNQSGDAYHKQYNLFGDPGLEVFPVDLAPYVTVTSPNGGEEWEQFTSQTVTWGDNIDGNVKIELLKGGAVAEVLASSTESDGSFDWDVPADYTPGTDYKVKISSVDSPALFDESDANFSIIEEYIIDAFPYREDFDALADTGDGAPLPEKWEQLSGDDFDWTVFEGPTPSNVGSSPGATGPSADHTTGNDKYIYVEASSPNNPDKKADFITPKFNFKSLAKPQLYFWCHMLSDSNTMGDLYLDINVDGTWHNDVVHLTDDHGDKWFADTVDLSSYKGDRVRFRFRGITGDLWASDIALDDITITAAPEFTSIPVDTVTVDAEYTYDVAASDEDDNGSGLKFGSATLPSWLTLSDNGNGTATLSGTPASSNAGDNPVVLTVSDGYIPEPVRQLFTINVVGITPPQITQHPSDITVTEGEPAEFSVTATGDAPLSYQWQKDQQDIAGAIDATYTIAATVTADNGGKYRCVVSNPGGSVNSNEATLTVNLKVPVVTADPQDIMVRENETATFSVSATGTALSYQWQKDQQGITGATDATYITPPTTMLDNNTKYRCVISNSAGSVTSGEAKLTVQPETSILDPITDNKVTSADLVISPNPADEYTGGIRFNLNVREVTSAELTVYDPLGNKLWETEFSGQEKWDLRNTGGTKIAGGTYLAVVWLTCNDGSVRQIMKTFGIQVE